MLNKNRNLFPRIEPCSSSQDEETVFKSSFFWGGVCVNFPIPLTHRRYKIKKARFCAHLPAFSSEKHLRTDAINMHLRSSKKKINREIHFYCAKNISSQ